MSAVNPINKLEKLHTVGTGVHSLYSHSLRFERSEDQLPVGARFSVTSRLNARPTQPPVQCVPALFPGRKAA
jgi:hypothetical protein